MIDPDANSELLYRSEEVLPDWYKTNIPCQVGCPARTDVSNYIGLISQGRFDEAYVLNRRSNVVPGVLGRTCARPCEPVCRRNKIDGNPVSICWLKRASHDHREYRQLPERPKITKRSEGCRHRRWLGGHRCARELAEMGYPVTDLRHVCRARWHDGRWHPRLAPAARSDARRGATSISMRWASR